MVQRLVVDKHHHTPVSNYGVLLLINNRNLEAKDVPSEWNKRYEELQKERTALYKEAIPYLETAVELDDNNAQAIQTLINIHSQLGNEDKVAKYKAMQ